MWLLPHLTQHEQFCFFVFYDFVLICKLILKWRMCGNSLKPRLKVCPWRQFASVLAQSLVAPPSWDNFIIKMGWKPRKGKTRGYAFSREFFPFLGGGYFPLFTLLLRYSSPSGPWQKAESSGVATHWMNHFGAALVCSSDIPVPYLTYLLEPNIFVKVKFIDPNQWTGIPRLSFSIPLWICALTSVLFSKDSF